MIFKYSDIKSDKQSGSSLIEVLIALLVLTIGILGMTAMQLSAKKLGHNTLQRSMAILQAHDISERIRNNSSALNSYVVNNLGDATGQKSMPDTNCFKFACSPEKLAAFDLWEWEAALLGNSEKVGKRASAGLVNPRACITHLEGLVTITIVWKGFNTSVKSATTHCGSGLNLYGEKDEERQVVFFTTFIRQEAVE